jgi:hypothetical protein
VALQEGVLQQRRDGSGHPFSERKAGMLTFRGRNPRVTQSHFVNRSGPDLNATWHRLRLLRDRHFRNAILARRLNLVAVDGLP